MAKRITLSPRRWTVQETSYLIEYRAAGMSLPAIAEQLGRTLNAVQDKWGRLKPSHAKPSLLPILRLAGILLGLAILGFCGVYVALNAPVA